MHHPAISHAAVIGFEEDGLTKPKAFVILRSGVTADRAALTAELQSFVKARLLPYKYPRVVEIVDDLPRNDRGKVDRKALRALETSLRAPVRP